MSPLSGPSQLPAIDRPPARWAFAQFVCIMAANFVLRAVREEMGVAGGVDNLPWLFTATFTGTLLLVPLHGWAASRWGRRTLARVVFFGLATSLVVLMLAHRGASLGTDVVLARAVFVWASVINMFAVASFWAAVVDIWRGASAPRVYAFVAAGGTIGALLGPSCALVLAPQLGATGLLGVAATFWALAGACAGGLERCLRDRPDVPNAAAAIGGSMFSGLRAIVREPALRGLAIYVLAFTATSTAIYLLQGRIVVSAIEDSAQRTALFAKLDLAVNVLALTLQLGVSGRLLATARLSATLGLLPLVTLVVLIALAVTPILPVLVVAQCVRRACEHAVAKPARELLYGGQSREGKYQGQNAVDTVIYRGGDAASAWLVQAAVVLVGTSGVAVIAALGAGAWLRFARHLADTRARPAEAAPEAPESAPRG